jgi:hypothetical protein
MCLPNFDGASIFGSLLDALKGGGWKLGPRALRLGQQRYAHFGPILQTTWEEPDYSLELFDFMPWPQNNRKRADEGRRVVIRRLRCTRGWAPCHMVLRPRDNFATCRKPTAYNENAALLEGIPALGFGRQNRWRLRRTESRANLFSMPATRWFASSAPERIRRIGR